MRSVDIGIGCAITISTVDSRLLYTGKLRQLGKAAKHIHHIRIREHLIAHFQQVTKILNGRRNTVKEMLLALEVSTETIGTQYLQRTEEDEKTQTVDKMTDRRNLSIVLQRLIIFPYEFTSQLERILCRCLPEERSQIVVERSFTPTLEINKVRIAIFVKHYVASLEISIQETVHLFGSQVFGKKAEISFQLQLMEIKVGGFQKTVLEVIQVEKYAVDIKLGLRIAVVPIHSTCSSELNVGQLANGSLQKFLFLLVVSSASFTSTLDGIKERHIAQIGLKIARLIIADCQDLRHRQLSERKVT